MASALILRCPLVLALAVGDGECSVTHDMAAMANRKDAS
jgi:hypothetical protein